MEHEDAEIETNETCPFCTRPRKLLSDFNWNKHLDSCKRKKG